MLFANYAVCVKFSASCEALINDFRGILAVVNCEEIERPGTGMSEITAEMIERGRGADPRIVAERRRVASKVREAREKLTSSGTGYRAFDVELLRLYASRRQAATPALGVLAMTIAALSLPWIETQTLLIWVTMVFSGIVLAHLLAGKFLNEDPETVNILKWPRHFVIAESVQGIVWAMIVVLALQNITPTTQTFVLFVLLLVAAMSVMLTSLIPASIYGALTPITLAIMIFMRPKGLTDPNLPLLAVALGTQLCFIVLAKKLYETSVTALRVQSEKDSLISELEQSRINSDEARRRAEEASLAKSRFLATMSHELRTPLNAILGFSEVMKGELFGPHSVEAYKDYSKDIHSSGEHLLMLINEILDLSRVEAGRYELKEESVSLKNVVEDCRHLLSLRAKKRDLIINDAIAGDLPRIWADERAVRQVALNLLSNAIKFTPQGGSITIKVGWTAAGGQYFSVRDTGPGIPENEIPVVMSSFGRGSMAQKNADEGTGLGLPIVKGLVELHGGTFTLKSKEREGTEVIVVFPPERVMNALPALDPNARPGQAQARPRAA